jgi:Ribbon-helix-helix domain
MISYDIEVWYMDKRIRVGSSVDPAIWEKIQQLSKDTRIPISKLLDEAMEDLINKYHK